MDIKLIFNALMLKLLHFDQSSPTVDLTLVPDSLIRLSFHIKNQQNYRVFLFSARLSCKLLKRYLRKLQFGGQISFIAKNS